jgi:hypothetical protein
MSTILPILVYQACLGDSLGIDEFPRSLQSEAPLVYYLVRFLRQQLADLMEEFT